MIPAMLGTPLAGALVSGGFSLAGGAMNAAASGRAARLNAMAQAEQNSQDRMFAAENNSIAREQWERNRNDQLAQFQTQLQQAQLDRDLQREFAQNGVQWRADDARAAGLHPLAALGAQLHSASPISISGSGGQGPASFASNTSTPISPFSSANMGSAVASMGQDISRALQATRTEEQRTSAVLKTQQDLQLQNMTLQNELLATQIAKTSQVGPPMPSSRSNLLPGQGNTVKNVPLERVIPNTSQEPGSVTEAGHTIGTTGHPNTMSKDAKERLEEDFFGTLGWNLRNRIAPIVGFNMDPPKHIPLQAGKEWRYNPLLQQYEQRTPLFGKSGFQPGKWYDQFFERR